MKLIVYEGGSVTVLDLAQKGEVYFKGNQMHPGYAVQDTDDRVMPSGDWLSSEIAMSMYEGAEAAGSFENESEEFSWSWAVLPENQEESNHLRHHASTVMYR
jgi:hypothetical protein